MSSKPAKPVTAMDSLISSQINESPAFDNLCSACQSIFQDDALHHLSDTEFGRRHDWKYLSELSSSMMAQPECHLCTMIFHGLAREQAHDRLGVIGLIYMYYKIELLSKEGRNGDDELNRHISLKIRAKTLTGSPLSTDLLITTLNAREKTNIMGRRLESSQTLVATTLSQIQSWLKTCREHHLVCDSSWKLVSQDRQLPTRLLHIGTEKEPKINLVDTASLPCDLPYLTLSHRWGSKVVIQLTSKTHASFKSCILYESLPKTFQDAVHLTRLLGQRYLWIDSLCIIQDSHEDWIHEASTMGKVYAHCLLNIAATASEDSQEGLFKPACSLSTSPCLISTESRDVPEASSDYMIYPDHSWQNNVEDTPLGKRGWVVQERILSPRIVHFASDQIYWDCCQEKSAELLPPEAISDDGELKKAAPYPGTTEADDPQKRWVYQNWNKILERYTTCSLTYDSDKLLAFSGLARRVCSQLGGKPNNYLAGLWATNIMQDLLWRVDKHQDAVETAERAALYRAPSWSWASIDGSILMLNDRVERDVVLRSHSRILNVETVHDGDPFGQIKGGYLRIQGALYFLQQGNCSQNDFAGLFKGSNSNSLGIWNGNWTSSQKSWFDEYEKRSKKLQSNDTFMFLLTTCHVPNHVVDFCGMVLQPTNRIAGQYSRIGVILHEKVGDLELMLEQGKDKNAVHKDRFQEHDPQHGFVIEII